MGHKEDKIIIKKQYNGSKISIDCAIFSYDHEGLKVLLVKEKNEKQSIKWKLASDCIKKGETIENTALGILKKFVGLDNFFLEQLKTFGYPSESSSQEDISIGYYALAKAEKHSLSTDVLDQDIKWCCIKEIKDLSYKHDHIFKDSLIALQNKVGQSDIAFNLLPEKFTLLQVKQLYEKILNIEIDTSNFRRKILQMGIVVDSNEKEKGVSHRAAKFYKFNADGYKKSIQVSFI